MQTATTPETLQQIIEHMQDVQSRLIESGGVLTPEIEALITSTEEKLEQKLDGYAAMIDYLKGQTEYLDRQAKLFAERKKSIENSIRNMRERMALAMETAGQSKIKTAAHTYSRTTRESWSINDNLTKEHMDLMLKRGLAEQVFKPSISKLKAYYKKGPLPDFLSVDQQSSITIR